jgi:hypothetical protein
MKTKTPVGIRNTETLCDMTAYGQGFLAPRPEIVLEDRPFLALCGYLLSIVAVTLLSVSEPRGCPIP